MRAPVGSTRNRGLFKEKRMTDTSYREIDRKNQVH
jgi:hypothetical protein